MYKTLDLTIKYKYHIKGFSNLIFWKKHLINIKTGNFKKSCYNGGSVGYWLDNKTFKSITWIKNNLVEVKQDYCPF